MNAKDLAETLKLHKQWLDDEDEGIRADLSEADLSEANLSGANLSRADLSGADLSGANLSGTDFSGADLSRACLFGADLSRADLRRANLSEADLRGANIDYAAWPIWCNSLNAQIDDRIARQLLYHTLATIDNSMYVSDDLKKTLLTEMNVCEANGFHRVNECGRLKPFQADMK